jgi:hypothetical protein
MSTTESNAPHLVQVHLVERHAVDRRLGVAEALEQLIRPCLPGAAQARAIDERGDLGPACGARDGDRMRGDW